MRVVLLLCAVCLIGCDQVTRVTVTVAPEPVIVNVHPAPQPSPAPAPVSQPEPPQPAPVIVIVQEPEPGSTDLMDPPTDTHVPFNADTPVLETPHSAQCEKPGRGSGDGQNGKGQGDTHACK